LLGPTAEVDDLLQETFLLLFRDVPNLRHDGALVGFVRMTAVNVARTHRRALRLRRLFGLLPTRESVPDTPTGSADPKTRVAVRRLYELLDRFPDKERTALVLRYIEGLELAEVAEATGASLATIKRRIARAVDRLRLRGRQDSLLSEYLVGVGEEGER
jgi:RNA polymerase sigma-70 factor (ECF subfamily)